VRFRISRHSGSGHSAPTDAVEQLWQQLPAKRDEASFGKVGAEIRAEWGIDAPVSHERDEREEIGRRIVLEIVRDVCERTPELKADWYAVSTSR
jgi:hypothetical protein